MALKYEGKPCNKCGNTIKYRSNSTCVICQSTWAKKNPNPVKGGRTKDIERRKRLAMKMKEAW